MNEKTINLSKDSKEFIQEIVGNAIFSSEISIEVLESLLLIIVDYMGQVVTQPYLVKDDYHNIIEVLLEQIDNYYGRN